MRAEPRIRIRLKRYRMGLKDGHQDWEILIMRKEFMKFQLPTIENRKEKYRKEEK